PPTSPLSALSLHDALPISGLPLCAEGRFHRRGCPVLLGGRPAAVVAVPRRTEATAGAEASAAESGAPASGDEPVESTTYDEFLATGAGAPVEPLPEDFSTYEESTRLYTSGTTGMPMGVALPSIV